MMLLYLDALDSILVPSNPREYCIDPRVLSTGRAVADGSERDGYAAGLGAACKDAWGHLMAKERQGGEGRLGMSGATFRALYACALS